MLKYGDEEFDQEGGGERCDAGSGYGALLIEGCVAKGLLQEVSRADL